MAFSISANLQDEKPYFRISTAAAATAHVQAVIDDSNIDRMHASRILRAMADRLLECGWPPDQTCSSS
jgi:hypothetical protein